MMFRNLSLACLVAMAACAFAQEPAKTPAEQYAAARGDWDKLQKDIQATVKEYQTAKEEEREPIRKKYTELVAKANKSLENLRTAAIAAYTDAPNKDEKVTTTL